MTGRSCCCSHGWASAPEKFALELDDLDWRAGTVSMRAKKGLRQERLPLPLDVGQALGAYLRGDRPTSACRRAFVRVRAPRGGFRGVGGVTSVVQKALPPRPRLVGLGAGEPLLDQWVAGEARWRVVAGTRPDRPAVRQSSAGAHRSRASG